MLSFLGFQRLFPEILISYTFCILSIIQSLNLAMSSQIWMRVCIGKKIYGQETIIVVLAHVIYSYQIRTSFIIKLYPEVLVLTLTVQVAVRPLEVRTVITAVPALRAFIFPVTVTVATPSSELVKDI